MHKQLSYKKSEVFQHLRCVVCFDLANDVRLCPHCSKLACNTCIIQWLTNYSNICPYCRCVIFYSELVKGYSINQLLISIKQLISSMDALYPYGLCDKHDNQPMSVFCYSCEMTICVKCWFSEDHADHKEHTAPVDTAFDHYKRKMTATLTWVNERKEVVNQVLPQLQEKENQLRKEKILIDTLCNDSEMLINAEASSENMIQILKTNREMTELRSNHQDETDSIRLDRRREFMSEPIKLVFQMIDFDRIIKNRGSFVAYVKALHGYEWKCTINDVYGTLFFHLRLIVGTPSEYSVQFDTGAEKVYRFELHTSVKIGIYKPVANVDNNTQQLTVYIRQS